MAVEQPTTAARRASRTAWVQFAVVPAGCVLGCVLLFGLAVHSGLGQRVDSAAVLRHNWDRTFDGRVWLGDDILLATIGALLACVIVAGRARIRLVLLVVAATGVGVVSAEAAQRELPRPMLESFDPLYGPSFPSGHAAAAMGLALGLLIVVPRLRWVRSVAAIGPGVVAVMLLDFPTHRPSDVLAGFLIAVGLQSVVLLAIWRWPGAFGVPAEEIDDDRQALVAPAVSPAIAAVRVAGTVVVMLAAEAIWLRPAGLTIDQLGAPFFAGVVLMVVCAEAVTAGFGPLMAAVDRSTASPPVD